MKTVLQITVLCLVAFGAYRVGYSAGAAAMYRSVVARYQTDKAGFEAEVKTLEDFDRLVKSTER